MTQHLFVIACMACACSRSNGPKGVRTDESASPASAGPSVARLGVEGGAAAHSANPPIAPGAILSSIASGYTSGLRVEADTISYCDNRGGRSWSPNSGVENAQQRACPSPKLQERNSDCSEIEVVADVRAPGDDDTIYLKDASSLRLTGRIQDCAFNAGVLLVATAMEVAAIDVKTGHRDVKSTSGGNQVAINGAWVAWSNGVKVFAQHR